MEKKVSPLPLLSPRNASATPSLVTRAVLKSPRSLDDTGRPIQYSYGTAGFRTNANVLDSAMVRVGILAALMSLATFKGNACKAVGVMVTASHNPDRDNGAKIMNEHGEMIDRNWEMFASVLANAEETQVWNQLEKFAEQFTKESGGKVDLSKFLHESQSVPVVFVGSDTRSSSENLKKCVIAGVEAMGGIAYDHGLVTTPQLHWIVREFNHKNGKGFSALDEKFDPAVNLNLYYENLSQSFEILMKDVASNDNVEVNVDCANGIGAVALETLSKNLKFLNIHLFNVDTKNSAKLNNKAGAEHVQKNRSLPEGVDPSKDVLKRFASVDGDADRLVYYYVEQSGKFQLLDGDKIMSLACGVLKDLVKEARLQLETGVVQTAYANGAATDYISKSLSVEVTCVPTGVKYLHHAAAEFDIGAYFEANGHGTVLFQPEALLEISKKSGKAVDRLLAFSRLINQAVGDAISDLLLVEACLAHKKWDLEKWNSIYSDLPSYQSKVAVPDRTLIKTTDAERRTVSPAGLQEALDEVVKRVSRGRAFVRPSGTEDVVRVYAEAETESSAKELGLAVEQVVKKYCV